MVLVKLGRKKKTQHEKNKIWSNKEKAFLHALFLAFFPLSTRNPEKQERSELRSDVIFINFHIKSISFQESALVSIVWKGLR